jgi:hypothetical protein
MDQAKVTQLIIKYNPMLPLLVKCELFIGIDC